MRRTVKELLVDAKDAAELMVDLAYAAVFFGDDDLAIEVLRLEDQVEASLVELRMVSMLAARTPEDAADLAGVLSLAMSIEGIADSAEDIARVQLKDLGVPSVLRDDLRHAEEVTTRIRLRDENRLAGHTLRELALPAETGMWVIAIRRGVEWIHGFSPDDVLQDGDVLFLQGPGRGVDLVRELAGAPPLRITDPGDAGALSDLDRAVDLVVELKNVSEVAVGLAYSAILLRDRALAAQVSAIEDRSDNLFHGLEGWVLRAARDLEEPEQLRGLLHLAAASERIVDAARSMTRVIETDEPPHPIIAAALSETDEITADAVIAANSAMAGATLREHRVHTNTGMEVLAVDRGERWIYRPKSRRELQAGDRLLAIGPEEGVAKLRHLAGDDRPTGDDGEWVMDPDAVAEEPVR